MKMKGRTVTGKKGRPLKNVWIRKGKGVKKASKGDVGKGKSNQREKNSSKEDRTASVTTCVTEDL